MWPIVIFGGALTIFKRFCETYCCKKHKDEDEDWDKVPQNHKDIIDTELQKLLFNSEINSSSAEEYLAYNRLPNHPENVNESHGLISHTEL